MASTLAFTTTTRTRENNRDTAARMMAAARRQREREAARRAEARRIEADPRLRNLRDHVQECMGYHGLNRCELWEEWINS